MPSNRQTVNIDNNEHVNSYIKNNNDNIKNNNKITI